MQVTQNKSNETIFDGHRRNMDMTGKRGKREGKVRWREG